MSQDTSSHTHATTVGQGDEAGAGDTGETDAAPARTGATRPGGAAAHVRHLVIGFLMGSAEVVPGVSGGTVALVGGIYTRLIDAVRDGVNLGLTFARGRFGEGMGRLRQLDWALLVPLLVAMAAAVLTLARVIDHYLETQPERLSGLFLGLVLGSVPVALRFLRRVDAATVLIVVGVGAALFVLLGLREETVGEAGDAATAPLWAYPLAASVAICAWILPGVSGSLMLVMMGMYAHVFGALSDGDLPPLVLFAAGAVIGLALFSKILAWLLEHHHDRMVAVMIGLMLGSVRVLWPWPNGVESSGLSAPGDDVTIPVLLAVVGFVVVLLAGRLGDVQEEPAPTD